MDNIMHLRDANHPEGARKQLAGHFQNACLRVRVGIVVTAASPLPALDHLFPRPELQPVVWSVVHGVRLT
jgi:hypothetical protein